MMRALRALDQVLDRLEPAMILAMSGSGILIVEGIDYVTGNEVSMALFYLGPVALASWYAGRGTGVAIALISCLAWFVADQAAGGHYSNAAIPVWNALVRLGFFLVTAHLLAALRESLASQQRLARTDDLTGLYRRGVLEERLGHDLALSHRHSGMVTIAYVDVDDFKVVNDAYGHAQGDRVLQAIASVLQRMTREVDTVARMGGDEFALVLPDTDLLGARLVISKISRQLRQTMETHGWDVTCSVGVLTLEDSAMSPERALDVADDLMYQVKRAGKGAVAFRVAGVAEAEPQLVPFGVTRAETAGAVDQPPPYASGHANQ